MSLLHAVGWALVHFVWQGTAVAVVLALALVAARRGPASFRYSLSAGALLLMMVVPIGTVIRLRQTSQPVFDAVALHTPTTANAPATLPSSSPAKARKRTLPGPRPDYSVGPAPAISADPGQALTGITSLRFRLERLFPWLVTLWALGVFVLSVRLLGGFLRARQLTTQGTKLVPEEWRRALARLSQALGVRATVRLMESTLVAMPIVIGWLRPVILLPGTVFTGLTPLQLEAILAHELAHIRRHDYLVNLIQAAIETVLFYHPAVWWVSRRLRAEREHCCDDLAVIASGDARAYAAALVDMERLRGAALAFALGAGGGGGGSLITQVRRLLAPSPSRAETAPRWAAGAVAVVAALAIGGASGVPYAVAEKTHEGKSEIRVQPLVLTLTQPPDTVLTAPDPAAPLADRWAWAQRQARTVGATGYWIGYTVKPPAGLDRMVYIDRQSMVFGEGISMSGRLFGDFRGLRFQGQPISALIASADTGSIKLLLEFRGTGRLARVHASSFVLPVDLGGHALLWLGAADDQSSLAILEPLYAREAPTVDLKKQVIDAIGIHGTSTLVVPALERHLAGGEPNQVRAAAAEWLGAHPVQPALLLLARLARTDRSSDVRREAAEAVGELKLPAATDTLIALARTLSDADARREAVEGLGERSDERARTALEAIARLDRQIDMQREAVETLGEFDGPRGIASLRDIARTHPSGDVRREAIETLGQTLAPADAVTFLADAARGDRDPDVQREAVETLGEVGTDAARAAVLAVAKTHPQPDVRGEAIETLGESWPSDETVDQLIQLARGDDDPDVQREAVETLGEIDGGIGLGAVVEIAMTHRHPDVRREAVETVGEHAAPAEAVKVLHDVIANDPSSDVQEEALETLLELPDGVGIPAVIEVARSHKNPEIRREALKKLAESDDPRARAIFERALGNP
jgi:beta-lactamase regulating signal transducer with metallopeptidase domain/HEAT repeat protein